MSSGAGGLQSRFMAASPKGNGHDMASAREREEAATGTVGGHDADDPGGREEMLSIAPGVTAGCVSSL